MPRRVAALVIGTEILTGKVREANVEFMARQFFLMGVDLRRVVVCQDGVDTIASEVRALRAGHDALITSGGVGPTLDDLTVAGVSKAIGRGTRREPILEEMIRAYWGDRATAAHLRMAEIPEGAELLSSEDQRWPVVCVDSIYLMPGVPEIFRAKFPLVREHFGSDNPFVSRALYLDCDEADIAAFLEVVASKYPEVAVGSYPRFGRSADYRVKITFDASEPQVVDDALAFCRGLLAAEIIVRCD